jgi:transposase-like protein
VTHVTKGEKESEDKILMVLKEIEGGATSASVPRAHGITDQTIYRCRYK